MSLDSFIKKDERIITRIQISRNIAEKCLDNLYDYLRRVKLKIDKKDFIPLAIAAYARFAEAHQERSYEEKAEKMRGEDLRDIAITVELSEEHLELMFAYSISKLNSEKSYDPEEAINHTDEMQDLWIHAIEVGLVILEDLLNPTYSQEPRDFFEAIENLSETARKIYL